MYNITKLKIWSIEKSENSKQRFFFLLSKMKKCTFIWYFITMYIHNCIPVEFLTSKKKWIYSGDFSGKIKSYDRCEYRDVFAKFMLNFASLMHEKLYAAVPEMLNNDFLFLFFFQYVPQDMINELNGVEVLNEEQEWQQQNNKNYYNWKKNQIFAFFLYNYSCL